MPPDISKICNKPAQPALSRPLVPPPRFVGFGPNGLKSARPNAVYKRSNLESLVKIASTLEVDAASLLAAINATGRPMNPRKTEHLTEKIAVPPSERITRSIQKRPWQSNKWHEAYGQRNQVENSNKTLKDVGSGDIENQKHRAGRGIAFHGIVSGFAVAAENLRRIIVGITKIARGKAPKTTRGSNRFDAHGNRIVREHQTETLTISPLTGPPRRE